MRALINVALPTHDHGGFLSVAEFRKIMSDLGLEPPDLPIVSYEEDRESTEQLRDYFLERARPIFDRMPENNDEEKFRKARTAQNIIYASELGKSNTLFMVTAQVKGMVRFRLLNPRVEKLQEGCEELVLKFRAYKQIRLEVEGEIQIFEHGLESSTISGAVVEGRLRGITSLAARDFILVFIGLVGFVILSLISLSGVVSDPWLKGQIDRFSTAMLTTIFASLVSIYYFAVRSAPVIKWTASFDI